MPSISVRATALPNSPIRKLVDYAIEAEKKGLQVHYLNIGQPDVESPPAFWDAVSSAHIKTLAYSHSAGIAPLRESIAKNYRSLGIDVDTSNILVTTGGSEATLMTFLSCFDPGDEVIVVEPFYANYAGFAVVAGITLVPITTKIEEDFALPSTATIQSKVTARTRGILLCNPSNPTGTVFSPEQLREIGQLAKERDLFLIVDEVYRDFYYGSQGLLSVLQIEGLEQNAVMLDSASKKFSLCGARVGFLVTRNTAVLASALKYGQARLASPTLDQIGVAACFDHTPPSYFSAVRKEYQARRDIVVSELAKMPGVVCPTIDGAFYAIVRLPVDDTDRFCEWLVREFQIDGQTLLLAPASGFYVTPGLGKQEVRIAYVLDQDRLKAAMKVLAAALAAYPATCAVA
ncbi:MAG TPA: pyridoxal phosphate-dependent aminotransferase [Fimbriimonadaceae bacterium]|nr:pyridoxal phosphate-dependent aminotransferase [Fimbriimonadaceae bacterium]